MKTLTEKYRAVLEGKYNKKQFVRDARISHPNHITQYNGFDDTVSILKNRGLIFEIEDDFYDDERLERGITDPRRGRVEDYGDPEVDLKDLEDELGFSDDEEELQNLALDYDDNKLERGIDDGRRSLREEYETPEPNFPIESIERGIDYELEQKGFNTVQRDFTEKDYEKAKKKVLSNLQKNPLYYLLKASGESTRSKKRNDQMVPANGKNKTDSANAMKKATLSEGRRKKSKGGKNLKEEDFSSGGYVEIMSVDLDRGIKLIQKAWDDWAEAPLTEPGMLRHAREDLVNYIFSQLDLGGKVDLGEKTDDKAEELVKESFKKLIVKVLTENKKQITVDGKLI